jgi:hypothetical protein
MTVVLEVQRAQSFGCRVNTVTQTDVFTGIVAIETGTGLAYLASCIPMGGMPLVPLITLLPRPRPRPQRRGNAAFNDCAVVKQASAEIDAAAWIATKPVASDSSTTCGES